MVEKSKEITIFCTAVKSYDFNIENMAYRIQKRSNSFSPPVKVEYPTTSTFENMA